MTTPGFQAQQAAQQAAQRASSAASSHAQRAYQSAEASRHASFVARSHHGGGSGVFGLLGRLIGFVVTLAVIALAVGIFLAALGRANPGALHQLETWLQSHG
ncbi:MAG: hypothetical protein ACRDP6_23600 [Actinoallomurus sp.]